LEVSQGLSILAGQAASRIYKSKTIEVSSPRETLPPKLGDAWRRATAKTNASRIRRLLEIQAVDPWDIFDSSDIGQERGLIAKKYVNAGGDILDVGCGRGFFAFACARVSDRVTAVDLMDGQGRSGWWADFLASARHLGVDSRIQGVRANSDSLPFRRGTFDTVTTIHSIRNFLNEHQIAYGIREAYRVLRRGGILVVAESEVGPKRLAAYGAFYSIRIKLGWEIKVPACSSITRWMRVAGFNRITTEKIETHLDYAPVAFPAAMLPQGSASVVRDYQAALKLQKEGRTESPPVMIVTGHKP
jgi:SAM-dependent methyltransferase